MIGPWRKFRGVVLAVGGSRADMCCAGQSRRGTERFTTFTSRGSLFQCLLGVLELFAGNGNDAIGIRKSLAKIEQLFGGGTVLPRGETAAALAPHAQAGTAPARMALANTDSAAATKKKGPRYLPRARQFLLPSEGGTNLNQWRRRSAPASNSPAPANSAFAGSGACTKPGDEACNSVWL